MYLLNYVLLVVVNVTVYLLRTEEAQSIMLRICNARELVSLCDNVISQTKERVFAEKMDGDSFHTSVNKLPFDGFKYHHSRVRVYVLRTIYRSY